MTVSKQQQRKIERILQNESRWLQKVLFAVGKTREARDKLAEAKGEKLDNLIVLKGGKKVSLDDLEEALHERVVENMTALGQRPPARG
jgi:predicted metal-dependent hydrolase